MSVNWLDGFWMLGKPLASGKTTAPELPDGGDVYEVLEAGGADHADVGAGGALDPQPQDLLSTGTAATNEVRARAPRRLTM